MHRCARVYFVNAVNKTSRLIVTNVQLVTQLNRIG